MRRQRSVVVWVSVCFLLLAASGGPAQTQSSARIDFARDVQPILQKNCVGCHGPTKQEAGYRLDRRSAALSGVVRPLIIPGSSESSRLYRRVIGPEFGTQMPPTGALAPPDIETLKNWIDQGAEWPEALANETPLPPADAAAVRLSDAIRARDTKSVSASLVDTGLVNARGRRGSTPLMYAALYGDTALLGQMLRAGGDPNIRNDAGATALMWAIDDIDKTRMLLDRGADPNALSASGRGPLILASGQVDSERVVQLLLERGAVVVPDALGVAAGRANLAVVRLLLQAGARDNSGQAAMAALRANCLDCIDAIASVQVLPPLRAGLVNLFPPGGGHPNAVRAALRLGADVNAKDAQSRTVLMKAVLADHMPPDIVQALIERGADVTVKNPDGNTALDFALRIGNATIIDLLVKAGATSTTQTVTPSAYVRGNSRSAAVRRSIPLLQRTAVQFYRKSGCVSCHQNALTAMTVAAARAKKIPVDEALAKQELDTVVTDAADAHDALLQGLVRFGGGPPTIGYVLMGLAAQRHQRDLATDAMVRLLRLSQRRDGHWEGAYRPPHESSEFTYTAVNLRGIQQYGPDSCVGCAEAIRRASAWLSSSRPQNTEDRVFRLFGLTWARAARPLVQSAVDDLLKTQRSDGGWAQLPSLSSDAYATGEALVALHEAGLSTKSPAYQRGIQFLLGTQFADGSWFVRSRSHPTQPYFESGFPHGVNQYISTAATNWATLALLAVD